LKCRCDHLGGHCALARWQDALVVLVNYLPGTTCLLKASCQANCDLASRVGTNWQRMKDEG
jgi:hypothetical protein